MNEQTIQILTLVAVVITLCFSILSFILLVHRDRNNITFKTILEIEFTDKFRERTRLFFDIYENNDWDRVAHPTSDKDREERSIIFDHLNYFELISIGMKHGAVNGSLFKDWMGGYALRLWNRSWYFVQKIRWEWNETNESWSYNRLIFRNFELLAIEIGQQPNRSEVHRIGPMTTPRPKSMSNRNFDG